MQAGRTVALEKPSYWQVAAPRPLRDAEPTGIKVCNVANDCPEI